MSALTRRALGGFMLGCLAPFGARAAHTTASSSGKPVLTISGHINAPGGAESVAFDMAALESVGIDGFETATPWYSGPIRFDGVRMSRLMQHVGATGDKVTAVALNDYTTELPISDFEKYGVILATKREGAYMPVRDKGPLFIVYPYDSAPELKAQRYYSRSAWQVTRLIVA
jgi:hypothetical protein